MVASASLSIRDNKKHEERKVNNIVLDEEYISREQKGICQLLMV
jgi:hypothetical protein